MTNYLWHLQYFNEMIIYSSRLTLTHLGLFVIFQPHIGEVLKQYAVFQWNDNIKHIEAARAWCQRSKTAATPEWHGLSCFTFHILHFRFHICLHVLYITTINLGTLTGPDNIPKNKFGDIQRRCGCVAWELFSSTWSTSSHRFFSGFHIFREFLQDFPGVPLVFCGYGGRFVLFWVCCYLLLTSPCGPLACAPSAPEAGIARVKANQQVNN